MIYYQKYQSIIDGKIKLMKDEKKKNKTEICKPYNFIKIKKLIKKNMQTILCAKK